MLKYINDIFGIVDHYIIRKLKIGYLKEVQYTTKRICEFIDHLEDKHILDNSMVIITADHGQLLGEHGKNSPWNTPIR